MPDLGALAVNLGVTLALAIAIALAVFAIGITSGRHRVIDVFWGIGFAVIAVAGLVLSAGHGDPVRRWLAAVLTMVWGLRLAVHIGLRSRGAPEDPRYERLLARAAGSRNAYALRMVYLLQAGALWVISWPVQVTQYGPDRPGPLAVVGVAVWAVGIFFESVGDAQLSRFRADPANQGRVLDQGLWRYTRHPNYFGDACVWWGLWLIGCGSWAGAIAIVSPLTMTYLLTRRTGTPLLEAHLASSRSGYADYVARTSAFIPRPPRRSTRE